MAATSVVKNLKSGSLLVGNTAFIPGSFESIATVTPSGTQTVTFNSIPNTYKHLQIRMITQQDYSTAGDFGWINVTFNGSSGTYASHFAQSSNLTSYGFPNLSFMYTADSYLIPAGNNSTIFGAAIIDILDYADTNKNKVLRCLTGVNWNTSGMLRPVSGLWSNTSAITSITLTAANGNLKSGSRFALYGIKG